MDPNEIKHELKIRGVTQLQISRELGVSRSGVHFVVNKKMRSARIQEAVAKTIQRDPKEVFPECYPLPRGYF